jgi:hypothetical protein
MPTVKELKAPALAEQEEVTEIVEEVRNDEKLKKANKVKRLQNLCKEGRRVGFLVYTPGTESGRLVHAATMEDATVEKTQEGNYIIKGRDLEEELKADLANGANPETLSVLRKRPDDQKKFRSYRIDRIINGTIVYI